jgi:iron complex outermembrane recepter protein
MKSILSISRGNPKQFNKHVLLQGNTDMKLNLTKLMAVLLALLLGALIANGETKQILTWRDALDDLQKLSAKQVEERRDEVIQIRTGIEIWLQLHPNTEITLEDAPEQPWNSEQTLKEAKLLREAVDAIMKEDGAQAFELGATKLTVASEKSPISPDINSVDRNRILKLHDTNVAEALIYLPGFETDYKADRNRSGIMIRGFDTRQVGVYLDGMPIHLPYDGYTDLSRFLTSDISEIETAKGYSSPLLGPNGLGGAVNIVTRLPEKNIEGDAYFGTGSGRRIESGAHVGSRMGRFFIRGGMDWLQTDYFPLPADYNKNSAQTSYERFNSDQRDVRYNGRIGWLPKNGDQYVFTYNKQKADNNVPSYAGINAANNTVRYWDFNYWNRDSYYFNSNTGMGEKNSIRFRAFYDKYPSGFNIFSDLGHTVMTGFNPSDDYSAGGSTEFSTRMVSRNALSASFFFKDDTHKEHALTYSGTKVTLNTPWLLDRDRYVSIGLQDALNLPFGVRATVGVSIDHLEGVTAHDLDTKNAVIPFACTAVGTTGTVTGPCQLADKWAYNPLGSISYSVAKAGTLFFTFAQKSRFPTLKDRYSYKINQAIPNPTLEPEHARNYDLGFIHVLPSYNTTIQVDVFRSDVYDAIETATIPALYTNQCKSAGSKICYQSVNVGDEIHKGAEFTVRTTQLRRLSVVANYTYLQRSITGPSTGSVAMQKVFPTGTPKHKVVGIVSWNMPRDVVMMATARYESGAFTVDNANKIYPASRFLTLDWSLTIPIKNIASLQGGAKNVLDRDYYYQEGYPEPGRSFYTTLRFRF